MSKGKVILAGGGGFIGKFLQQKFIQDNYEVLVISRSALDLNWLNTKAIADALNGSEVVINLSGKSINCRLNEKNMAEIIESRITPTKILGEIISSLSNPPKLWINASAIGIYPSSETEVFTESNRITGVDFLASTVKKWEDSFFDFHFSSCRQIAFRFGVVLGKDGGAASPLIQLAKKGLGGKQGSGKQIVSWVYLSEIYKIICFTIEKHELNGPINVCSPKAISNNEMMKSLRSALKIPFGLSTPIWQLKLAAIILGLNTDLVLNSNWVSPKKLLDAGYKFEYASIDSVWKEILSPLK